MYKVMVWYGSATGSIIGERGYTLFIVIYPHNKEQQQNHKKLL